MTVKAAFFSSEGKRSEVDLSSDIFEVQINVPILHEAVKGQLAAARAGTHSTKTRGEVRGGGAKPWRQKGTGRARHGSIREPQWVGGGVAHGPKPRDYSMRINKKAKAQALRSALSDRASEGKVLVVDLPTFEEPETKKAVQLLSDWGADGKTLLIVAKEQEEELLAVWKSFRNLPEVLMVTYPTAYTVLAADTVIFTQPALEALTTQQSQRATKEQTTKEPKTKKGEAEGGSAATLQAESGRSTRPDEPAQAAGTARFEAGSGDADPDPAPPAGTASAEEPTTSEATQETTSNAPQEEVVPENEASTSSERETSGGPAADSGRSTPPNESTELKNEARASSEGASEAAAADSGRSTRQDERDQAAGTARLEADVDSDAGPSEEGGEE